ncbi:hypothetical protein GOBAR_DD06228 [Gossypium barbadense]|nr:hypothetical protein GOBAR_DD06228 [Gossypium barbadense]
MPMFIFIQPIDHKSLNQPLERHRHSHKDQWPTMKERPPDGTVTANPEACVRRLAARGVRRVGRLVAGGGLRCGSSNSS